jgi:hypothetical protein
MAGRRQTGAGSTVFNDVDEYFRDEYRAERGAYLEPRPAYRRPAGAEPARRYWGPRLSRDYSLGEDFAGAGTELPPDRPLDTTEPGFATPADRARFEERRPHAPSYRGRGPKSYVRSDERIREDVNDRLTDDPHLDASEIEVTVENREVTLSGHVNSRFEKRHAEDLAESVSGVSHVQNNLRVQQPETTGSTGSGTTTRHGTASGAGLNTGAASATGTSGSTTGTGSATRRTSSTSGT